MLFMENVESRCPRFLSGIAAAAGCRKEATTALKFTTGAFRDSRGRLMAFMTHNTDVADTWEREGENKEYFNLFRPAAMPSASTSSCTRSRTKSRAVPPARGFSRPAPRINPQSRRAIPVLIAIFTEIEAFQPNRHGIEVATCPDVPHSRESVMVPTLFEGLFIISLVAPPLAVGLGLIMLLVPTRMESAGMRRDMPAHA
jgi:hypothetical protein